MKKISPNFHYFLLVIALFCATNIALGKENLRQKYLNSIDKMVETGALSEQEGKEQIGQLKISEESKDQEKIKHQSRGIASTLSEQKIIEFSNEPVEIQVK